MTDRLIEDIRLDAARLGLERGLLLSEVGRLVALVETGALPPLDTVARAIANGPDDKPTPPAPAMNPTPPRVQAAAPGPHAGPDADGSARRESAPVPAPTPPPARAPIGGTTLAALPRWTAERKALMRTLMAPHQPPYHRIPWHAYATELTALPGPPVSGGQARDWRAKVGMYERAAGKVGRLADLRQSEGPS